MANEERAERLRRLREALSRGELPAEKAEPVEEWARAGDAEAQFVLARWRQRQYDDPWVALDWLEAAAVQGHRAAAEALADLYRGDLPHEESQDASARQAAQVVADAMQAWRLQGGPELEAAGAPPPLFREVLHRLEALATDGNAHASHRLGLMLWRSGSERSPGPWLLGAAEAHLREAQHALGEFYLEQFDEGHFEELLDEDALPDPVPEELLVRLEWQRRLSPAERARLEDQRAIRDQAFRWLGAAADQGDREACVTLAEMFSRSGPRFGAEAARAYERAAELGDPTSMVEWARRLEEGSGVPEDAEAARAWYTRAAAAYEQAGKGDDGYAPFALSALAELYLRGRGRTADPDRARSLLEEAAARNHHWAMQSLGRLYEYGDGLPRSLAKAEEWYARAVAAGGGAYPQECLDHVRAKARTEATSTLVAEVPVENDLLRRAETGDPLALWSVARALEEDGQFDEARPWLERAARAGHAAAAFKLAFGNSDDGGEAARGWRRHAARLGHVSAMRFIGDELLDPEAERRDPALGYAWIVMATRERHDEPSALAARERAMATAWAAEVLGTLTPEEKTRAEAIVAACDAGPPFRLPDEVETPSSP